MRSRVAIAVLALVAALVVPLSPAAQAAGVPATTTITVSPAGAVPAGTTLTVTVSVVGYYPAVVPLGEVVLAVNGVTQTGELTEGTADFTVPGSDVLPGTIALSASYAGDENHDPSSAETGVLVSFVDYPPLVGDQIAPFYADIRWMTGQGITAGYPDNGYHPTAAVTRQAMAAFLYRAAHPGQSAPACTTAPFIDVPTSNPFCAEITWLAQQGISTGYSDGTFRPSVAVSRGAMAQFLYRFKVGPTAPACTTAPFADVPTNEPSCGAIKWLVGKGVTNGYSDGTFRTTAPVSRQAMAAFLHRLFGDAIRTLKPGSVELDPADVISISEYFGGGGGEVVVRSSAALPSIGGVLIVSAAIAGGTGVFGKVVSIGPVSAGRRTVTIDYSATLDDAYSQLHIVATNLSIPEAIPGGGGFSRSSTTALNPEFECDGPAPAITVDATNLKISSFDLDLGLHAPRMFLAISYDPSVTVSIPAGPGLYCQVSSTILPPIVIPSPPIVISTSAFGSLSISAGAPVTATAGIHIGASITADGGDSHTNLAFAPHADVGVDASELAVGAVVGITVEAKLGGVVGLSGSLGVGANIAWGSDGLGRDCLTAKVGPVASLSAVLDVFVHEFTATLLESSSQKEVWKRCYGGGTWSGTASENLVGTGTWATGNGAWVSVDHTDISRSYVLVDNVSTATISGSRRSTVHYNFSGVVCNDTPEVYADGPVVENQSFDFYAGISDVNGFWPRVGAFSYTAHHSRDTTNTNCQGTPYDSAASDWSITPQPMLWGPLGTGTVYALTCDPVDLFPRNVQAIKLTVTINCTSTQEGRSATATAILTYDLVKSDCDTRVDSDGDGVGDCAEYYAGGEPNHAD